MKLGRIRPPHRQGARVQPALRAGVHAGRTREALHAGIPGWEKGQVEIPGPDRPGRFVTPRLGFKTGRRARRAWLLDQCVACARRHPRPVFKDRTVWQVFEDERPSLVGYRGPFDGFHAVPASVSKTCLVRFDSNKYSVAARAVGRPVEVPDADRIVAQDRARSPPSMPGASAASQTVRMTRGNTCPCWRGSPVRDRNGAPFKDWGRCAGRPGSLCASGLPATTTAIRQTRRDPHRRAGGWRMAAVEAACAEAQRWRRVQRRRRAQHPQSSAPAVRDGADPDAREPASSI